MCYLGSGMEMPPLKNTPETKVEGLKALLSPHDIEHAFCTFDTQSPLLYNEYINYS